MDWSIIITSLLSAISGGVVTSFAKLKFSQKRDKLDLIKELNSEMATKTLKIRELQDEVLSLKDKCHEFEMRLLSSRCDLEHCGFREPPLPWKPKKPEDNDGDGKPDLRPVPQCKEDTHPVVAGAVKPKARTKKAKL